MGAAPKRDAVPGAAAGYRAAREAFGRGDLAAAITGLRELIKKSPEHAGALNLLGIISMQGGRAAEAEALFARAVAAQPAEAGYHNSHAGALHALGRSEEALAAFGRALAINPDYSGAHLNLGGLLVQMGRAAEALPHFERLCMLRPEDAALHFQRAELLCGLRRFGPAITACQRVLELQPQYPDARFCLGNALWGNKQAEAALAEYSAVIAADPGAAGAWANRSVVQIDLGRPDDALADIEQALQLKPGNPDFHNLHGNALQEMHRFTEAITAYQRARQLQPGHVGAAINEAVCLLLTGDFARGWPCYESRWQGSQALGAPALGAPRWNGKRVKGSLLVWAEQGMGDQIHQLGIAGEGLELADRYCVAVHQRLHALATRSLPGIRVITTQEAAREACDFHAPLYSLGGVLRRSWNDFPRRQAYLLADPARIARLREKIDTGTKLLCGLSWRSSAPVYGPLKSVALPQLSALLGLDGWTFVDLQYGDTAVERASSGAGGAGLRHLEGIDLRDDLEEVAALISCMDVVVTVSNTTAHLSGALGIPTLLLLPWSAGRLWYWHEDREDSPWYPSLRLFRQQSAGRWDEAVEAVGVALAGLRSGAMAAGRAAPLRPPL